MADFATIFTGEVLEELFPPERTNAFFEALFGDAEEGAYDIRLSFKDFDEANSRLLFHLNLLQRPGACLACNLTYGLPDVFSRHPIIDIKGLIAEIEARLPAGTTCEGWKLDTTIQQSKEQHIIPLLVTIRQAA